MTEEDLERAVAAAMKFGLRTPEEIADFAIEWLAPMVHIKVRETTAEDLRAARTHAMRRYACLKVDVRAPPDWQFRPRLLRASAGQLGERCH